GLVGEDLLLDVAEALAAELGGPADAQPPVAAHPADHVLVRRAVPVGEHRLGLVGRDEAGEVLAQLLLQLLLLGGQIDEHAASTPRSRALRAPRIARRDDGPPTRRTRSLVCS